jgi:beta-lactamase superfamily II metal-dependent hydrolase
MDIITVNVGQGALAIVRHNREAIIADSRIPPSEDNTVAYVKEVLAKCLKDHFVKGLILTGFDADHSDATGVGLILPKYRPDWIMYPTCFKDTQEADDVFEIVDREEVTRRNTNNPLQRVSVCVDKIGNRVMNNLSDNFGFELFSPHTEDMNNLNNSSIVVRLMGKGLGGFSYLITGDTETERWERINQLFGEALRSNVMAAPHHGAINGVNSKTLLLVEPNTVLISAGVNNQYGHPDSRAVQAYQAVAQHVFCTNVEGGVSLFTKMGASDFETQIFR